MSTDGSGWERRPPGSTGTGTGTDAVGAGAANAEALGAGLPGAVAAGAAVGVVGGLIGLGGAEFRLPLLIAVFGFAALQAVILNKAMSLVVVLAALPVRLAGAVSGEIVAAAPIVLNLLAGSLAGAWVGATWATRMRAAVLHRVLAVLLVVMAAALVGSHAGTYRGAGLSTALEAVAGLAAGFAIGVVAAVMGVAGGELLIPTIVVLYGTDIKLAGTLSLLVSLPTMLVAFARYSRDGSFAVLRRTRRFTAAMAAGSVAGAALGAVLVGVVSESLLVPTLCALLLASSVKVWRTG